MEGGAGRMSSLQLLLNHLCDHRAIGALRVFGANHQRHFALAGALHELVEKIAGWRLAEFTAITLPEFRPFLRLVSVPLPKFRRGCDLFHPIIHFQFFLADAARPETVHQNTIPILGARLIIGAFHLDGHRILPSIATPHSILLSWLKIDAYVRTA